MVEASPGPVPGQEPFATAGADQFRDRWLAADGFGAVGSVVRSLAGSRLRSLVRSLRRAVFLLALILAANLQARWMHLIGRLHTGPEGAIFMHRWSRRFLRAIGVDSRIEGEPLHRLTGTDGRPCALIVNHLSYLDALVLSAAHPFVMVAKSEVRSWPLLGWLTAQAGTVYVTRGGGPATYPGVNAAMAEAFLSGLPVVFFPEGTTTDGSGVLPLRRGLFHSVLKDRVQVRAAALKYTAEADGGEPVCVAGQVCWWGEASLVPHLFRLLGLRRVEARLRVGPAVEGNDRFELAENGRCAIAEIHRSFPAR